MTELLQLTTISNELHTIIRPYLDKKLIRKLIIVSRELHMKYNSYMWEDITVVNEDQISLFQSDTNKVIPLQAFLFSRKYRWILTHFIKSIELFIYSSYDFFELNDFSRSKRRKAYFTKLIHGKINILGERGLKWCSQFIFDLQQISTLFKTTSITMKEVRSKRDYLDSAQFRNRATMSLGVRYNGCTELTIAMKSSTSISSLNKMENLTKFKYKPLPRVPKSVLTEVYNSISGLPNLRYISVVHFSLGTLEALNHLPIHVKDIKLTLWLGLKRPRRTDDLSHSLTIPQITSIVLGCDEEQNTTGVAINGNSFQKFWRKFYFPNLKNFGNWNAKICSYRSLSFSLIPVSMLHGLTTIDIRIFTIRDCQSLVLNIGNMKNLSSIKLDWNQKNIYRRLARREMGQEIFRNFAILMENITSAVKKKYPSNKGFGYGKDKKFGKFLDEAFEMALNMNNEYRDVQPLDIKTIKNMVLNPNHSVLQYMEFEGRTIETAFDPLEKPVRRRDVEISFEDYQPNVAGILDPKELNMVRQRAMERRSMYKFISPQFNAFIQYRFNTYSDVQSERLRYVYMFLNIVWPLFFYEDLFRQFIGLPKLKYVTISEMDHSFSLPSLYRLFREHKQLNEITIVSKQRVCLYNEDVIIGTGHYDEISELPKLKNITIQGLHHFTPYVRSNTYVEYAGLKRRAEKTRGIYDLEESDEELDQYNAALESDDSYDSDETGEFDMFTDISNSNCSDDSEQPKVYDKNIMYFKKEYVIDVQMLRNGYAKELIKAKKPKKKDLYLMPRLSSSHICNLYGY